MSTTFVSMLAFHGFVVRNNCFYQEGSHMLTLVFVQSYQKECAGLIVSSTLLELLSVLQKILLFRASSAYLFHPKCSCWLDHEQLAVGFCSNLPNVFHGEGTGLYNRTFHAVDSNDLPEFLLQIYLLQLWGFLLHERHFHKTKTC